MPDIINKIENTYSNDIRRFAKDISHPNVGLFNQLRGISVVYGDLKELSPKPDKVHICDGTDGENSQLLKIMQQEGTIVPLPKYQNCWLARTNPADTARVESKTFICTENRSETITTPKEGRLHEEQDHVRNTVFDGTNRFPLSKIGIELTDSPYVVASMRIMTRMGKAVLNKLVEGADFVKCLHSVGVPANGFIEMPSWPCDPERTIILHRPKDNEIVSYGSGYGGNSLLGKKCFALRIGSTIAKREGWLAEHMLILGITNPEGKKRYIAAAFPSACGKTNLAMMTPTLPGYKVECVGDDIAWMRFDNDGVLRAINPENGFFGVAPGTSNSSNPIAMKTIFKNTVFTNVASTSDGGVFWEGMEDEIQDGVKITDWRGNQWVKGGSPAAHPNSRFCTPAAQCPIIDPAWEDPAGVPISAILFGGRRPAGVPLVYEARDWKHGVLIGASMRSEATAAAEHKGKVIMHDPFAMRPFFGYNFGHYLSHWLSMETRSKNLPKIFHVNWFRKGSDGKFLWPGFGENSRVLDWILRRLDNEDCAQSVPIGLIPKPDSLNLKGLKENVNLEELFALPKDFWLEEVYSIERYFKEQVGRDLPQEINKQLGDLKYRIEHM
ncbi:hypothetical protein NQ317_011080 [Molorchus minor]|uniref:phosphoenolpyruvate carboxykinase (GTP) n=1 Tax=Molorchus minor TaxID=1323400 RepID=A0ABQ9IX64_9CUCU|nr:hypothetical protein NQ317_011080 [Molorchus minor]